MKIIKNCHLNTGFLLACLKSNSNFNKHNVIEIISPISNSVHTALNPWEFLKCDSSARNVMFMLQLTKEPLGLEMLSQYLLTLPQPSSTQPQYFWLKDS